MITILYLGTFITATLLVIIIYNYFFAGRISVINRLKKYSQDTDTLVLEEDTKGADYRKEFFTLMGALGRVFSRKGPYMEKLRIKLMYARWYVRPDEFVGFKFFFGLMGGIVFYLILGGFGALLGLILGFVMPDFVLTMRGKSRMNQLTLQLPEALTIIANGLRAGLGFYQSLGIVVRDMESPIKDEFEQVIYENSMGKPTDEVLENLKERTDSEDLDILIAALLIQKQVGGSLAEILDSISHTIRERVRIKGEIKTLTSQGRLSALIIILLPVFIGIVINILNPEYGNLLFTSSIGQIMLLLVGVMMVIGVVLVRRIVDIEV